MEQSDEMKKKLASSQPATEAVESYWLYAVIITVMTDEWHANES